METSSIWWLLLHFRQQDQPCSIDMIECYQWTLWLVPKGRNGLIYTQYHCSLWFRYFWNKWAISRNGKIQRLLLHFRQQDQPCSIDTIEFYQWTLRLVPKGGNGLIYTQYHCSVSFRYFRRILSNKQTVVGEPSSFASTTQELESLQFGCWSWRLRSR